jgi:hypothetical protein
MSLNIHETVRFYEQKFHTSISLVTSSWGIDHWNNENILLGLPANVEKEIDLNGMQMQYDPGFTERQAGEVIKLEDVPIARVGKRFLIFHFNPLNEAAENLVRQMIDKAAPRLARHVRQQQLNAFMNGMKQLKGRICEERESAIQSKEWEIERNSRNILDLTGEISALRLDQFHPAHLYVTDVVWDVFYAPVDGLENECRKEFKAKVVEGYTAFNIPLVKDKADRPHYLPVDYNEIDLWEGVRFTAIRMLCRNRVQPERSAIHR